MSSRLDNILTRIIPDSPITVFGLDANGVITICTGRAGELSGIKSQEFVGQSAYDISQDIPDAENILSQVFSEETGITSLHFHGLEFDIWHTPLYDDKEETIGVAGIAIDVTQRWRIEEKLREEQSLLERMLRFHERDRQLIAYEIHDGLIQDATAAQMLLNSVLEHDNLPEGELRATIQEAGVLVQKAMDEARRLIGGLRPSILEEMGVVSAISYLINNLPANKHTINFITKLQFERLEPLLEATIYRIVQQAVNNIQRHSCADRAEIRLTQQGDWIHLEIQDWGIGFDLSNVSEDRFGLQGIRERARLMRGRAVIDSAPGKGTQIIVELPVAYPLEK